MFERLHIDFSKKGWRASNKRDEFIQMTTWVARRENVHQFERYLTWLQKELMAAAARKHEQEARSAAPSTLAPPSHTQIKKPTPPDPPPPTRLSLSRLQAMQRLLLPKRPTCPCKDVRIVALDHSVPSFSDHLLQYINGIEDEKALHPITYHPLPFGRVDVYHSFKFTHDASASNTGDNDWVKATPTDGGRYNTVVILDGSDANAFSLVDTRIGRVRIVFKIPETLRMRGIDMPTPSYWPKVPLAYVQLFIKPLLTKAASRTHNMPSVSLDLMWRGKHDQEEINKDEENGSLETKDIRWPTLLRLIDQFKADWSPLDLKQQRRHQEKAFCPKLG
ncbi:hypothetical protein CYLTODRAFT_460273 [Cylindrobasidium torrendii FP15055 ss-10]|uniref:Uncharacterized protein n=1 Tax=Cylindrobasidium torrendii FP15055 ss-10 TaxID=1314674 RepID=A0A0D7AUI3_9AGAR|nr:hypothetical protein CYLTODRAFT_460273 [Cylindrobasidium torrendii FP15055 ss-10]